MTTPADPSSGWTCAVCGASVPIATAMPWRCPNRTELDRHHVLVPPSVVAATPGVPDNVTNPFVRYDHRLAWAAHAARHGIGAAERLELVQILDDAVVRVAGVGFAMTPYGRNDALSDELGFAPQGGVFVKDETGGVAGSHKARHLASILLHLLVLERRGAIGERPRLAIASCGNAARAAATLARAVDWPIDVFVPEWMQPAFGRILDDLGAVVHRCARREGDPPGDPAMRGFRRAVAGGSVPFTVQGPENALCLDGGRTTGWEIADQHAALGGWPDRALVQVGGGALASCLGAGLGATTPTPLYPVQAVGCAPLLRAWARAGGVTEGAGTRWSELMTPWDAPTSVADGILDDETYDWLGVFAAMRAGGHPIAVTDDHVVSATDLLRRCGVPVSPTGAAGLAGVLAVRDSIADEESVVVVASGVQLDDL